MPILPSSHKAISASANLCTSCYRQRYGTMMEGSVRSMNIPMESIPLNTELIQFRVTDGR